MKRYIFVIRRICNITGAQQYVYNKKKYLESKGWRVLIFSSVYGQIMIDDFKKFEKYIYPQLYWAPVCFKKKEIEATLKRIINEIGQDGDDECIIESDSFQRAIWAELIASKLQCRHLAFFMQEKHSYNQIEMTNFLTFKYNRHELAGITPISINQMLGSEVAKRDDTRILAYCDNVIDSCADSFSTFLDTSADYTLGSLGRMDKPCVNGIIDGICSYAIDHKDKSFNVVMIGGGLKKKKKEKITEKISRCNNINLIMTGNVYPVPLSFASLVDVFISTAGSASATYRAGIPTVLVHPLSAIPVGVMGLDFMYSEKTMYDISTDLSIQDCIERAIKERNNIVFEGISGDEYNKAMYNEFERQLSFVNSINTNEYYDESLLVKMYAPSTYGSFKPWLMGHLFGGKGFSWIWKYSRKS